MIVGGMIQQRVGARIGTMIGCSIYMCVKFSNTYLEGFFLAFRAGLSLTYFAIQDSFAALLIMFGIFSSIGQEIAYVNVLAQCQRVRFLYRFILMQIVVEVAGALKHLSSQLPYKLLYRSCFLVDAAEYWFRERHYNRRLWLERILACAVAIAYRQSGQFERQRGRVRKSNRLYYCTQLFMQFFHANRTSTARAASISCSCGAIFRHRNVRALLHRGAGKRQPQYRVRIAACFKR